MSTEWKPGLDGVVAARTSLTQIDGTEGRLFICGYPMKELAPAASFEETIYLLWNGRLPDHDELRQFTQQIAGHRKLPAQVHRVLQEAATRQLSPMQAVRQGIDAMPTDEDNERLPAVLVGAAPTIVATYWRLLNGFELSDPKRHTAHAATFLSVLHGRQATQMEARALETYLNTMIDHGLNASTFTARVITSTRSDLKSAVVGALGALKGPIHGGAPQPVLQMLQQIGSPDQVEPYLRDILERGERIMGFGHREYRVRDPRAQILADAWSTLAGHDFNTDRVDEASRPDVSSPTGEPPQSLDDPLRQIALEVERQAPALLDEYKPGRNLRTNAEFYTALLLHRLGIAPELFTAVFAVSRIAGWIAHAMEQRQVDRIFRPASEYCGPSQRRWLPVEDR